MSRLGQMLPLIQTGSLDGPGYRADDLTGLLRQHHEVPCVRLSGEFRSRDHLSSDAISYVGPLWSFRSIFL